MQNQKLDQSKLWRSKGSRTLAGWLSILLIHLTATACSSYPYDPRDPTKSPLIPGSNMILTETAWQLVEGTYQGKPVEIEAIQPVYLSFTIGGELLRGAVNCNSAGYYIVAKNAHQYRLLSGTSTAMYCGDVGNQQENRLHEAILATSEYVLEGEQLLLIGEDVRLVLSRPVPLLPVTNTLLSDNRWRITEVTYQGEAVDFTAIQPAYITFNPAGQLVQDTSNMNCNIVEYLIQVAQDGDDGQYRLMPGQRTERDCGEVGNRQDERLTAAIGATTGLMIDLEHLFLTGEDVRIVLEIDN